MVDLAQTVPAWPVAMAMSSAELDLYQRNAAESQVKSLVTTGVVAIPPTPPKPSPSRPASHRPDAWSVSDTKTAPQAAAESARLHAQALAAAADAARSEAERLLFQILESHPKTKGRFVLNGCPGFKFGARPAEVDLLASDLRLAVEIDGFYHFTRPDNYRRDRRMDWLLQRHGYSVVRVLAEDVAARMEEVLDFLVRVVDDCERAATQ